MIIYGITYIVFIFENGRRFEWDISKRFFFQRKYLNFEWNFIEVCSEEVISQP